MKRALLAEALGTLGLVLFATGATALNEQTGALGLGGVAAVCGLIVFGLIQAFGEISGAHLNPAVTVGFWAAGRFPARYVLPYVAAQVIGGLAGSGLVWLLIPDSPTLGGNQPGFGVLPGLGAEVVLTFWLMLIVLRVADGSHEQGLLAGLTIGGVVTLEILAGGPVSGGSMNPIRSLAPAIVSGHLVNAWIYAVGPVVGALLAVGADRLLRPEFPSKS
jgi:MIP family channel proteins